MRAPVQPFRTIRGEPGGYAEERYDTREDRDAAAARYATQDGVPVLCEEWSTYHPHDDLNKGWACDKVARPEEQP